MNFKEVEEKVQVALDKLSKNEQKIIANNISERAITHKLAEYLQQEFPDYDVDCEYNRNFEEGRDRPKFIEVIRRKVFEMIEDGIKHKTLEEVKDQVSTYPDIIVHERLANDRNLLVVEVKKSNNNNNADWSIDDEKLNYFTDQKKEYKFQLGLHIEIFVKNEWEEPKLRWFIDGKESEKLL